MKRSSQSSRRIYVGLLVYCIVTGLMLYATNVDAASKSQKNDNTPAYYGAALCKYPQYECIKVKSGQNWQNLFPNESQRDLVQRINRTHNWIGSGRVLAVPKNLPEATLLEHAPFPHHVAENEKQIIVDQDKLAWAAYDADGNLINWGPISSGRTKCPDSAGSCLTLAGMYRIFNKENEKCKSDIFPVGRGGALMPYCMFFHKGFALHGAKELPGYRASHGCVRLFEKDAKWLNLEFVDTGNDSNDYLGTKVVVRPVTNK